MDLRQRLQEETKLLHDNIEQTFLLKKILHNEITLTEYRVLIQKFYSFITPCEDLILSLPCKSAIQNRLKKQLLLQDMYALGILNNNEDVKLPMCMDLPTLSKYEHVLGYLYVMEGSTLGGQIIIKMIKKYLPILQHRGGRYFHGYGYKTRIMWNDFCIVLNRIDNIEQINTIIHSATDTFKCLHKWMEAGHCKKAQEGEYFNE